MFYHYNIGFTVVFLATCGPYIIQYSSMMNAFHNKGCYKEPNLKDAGFFRKLYLYLATTFIGLLIMIIVDILQKIESIIRILLIPISCKVKSQRNKSVRRLVQEWIHQEFFEKIFKLNSFELDTFEKQKKFTQVLFEDMVMLVLYGMIQFKYLNVKELSNRRNFEGNILFFSFLTTIYSITTMLFTLFYESRGLKEN